MQIVRKPFGFLELLLGDKVAHLAAGVTVVAAEVTHELDHQFDVAVVAVNGLRHINAGQAAQRQDAKCQIVDALCRFYLGRPIARPSAQIGFFCAGQHRRDFMQQQIEIDGLGNVGITTGFKSGSFAGRQRVG